MTAIEAFLKSPTKTALWLGGHRPREQPSEIWKQGQDFSLKICFWCAFTYEWITSEIDSNFRREDFWSRYYKSSTPWILFLSNVISQGYGQYISSRKNTSKQLNGHIGCKPTKLRASAKIIFQILYLIIHYSFWKYL